MASYATFGEQPEEPAPATDHMVDDQSYLELRAIAKLHAMLDVLNKVDGPAAVARVLAEANAFYSR